VFASDPEAKGVKADKKAFAEAMARLFTARKIRVDPFGPASKMRSKIVEVEASNDPFQRLPTPSNGVCAHTPHTPPTVGTGQRALEDAARSNGPEGKQVTQWGVTFRVIGPAPKGTPCAYCTSADPKDGSAVMITNRGLLHENCVAAFVHAQDKTH
jgi:hypothetical protein